MSNYTTELRYVLQGVTGIEETDYNSFVAICNAGAENLFDTTLTDTTSSSYNWKRTLATAMMHYYTREICDETFGRWKLRANAKLRAILPYYDKMVDIALKAAGVDPFSDVNYKINETKTKQGTEDDGGYVQLSGTDTVNNTDTTKLYIEHTRTEKLLDKFADTPQGKLTNVLGEKTVNTQTGEEEVINYLTNARLNDNVITDKPVMTDGQGDTVESVGSTTYGKMSNKFDKKTYNLVDEVERTIAGKMGTKSYAQIIKEFRETILNIDEMIIDELDELFIQLWD